jgi:chromosome partitioning protein
VIIDSPPHTETEARTAIRAADLIIIPVQPSPTDLWATKATLELAKNERIPVRVVLNRVPANSRLAATIAAELPELADTTLGNRVLSASSLLEGRSATEVDPTSAAASEVKSLVKEILKLTADDEPEVAEKKTKATKRELESA